MADNVTLPATGAIVATEETASNEHIQYVLINTSVSAKSAFTDFATQTTLASVLSALQATLATKEVRSSTATLSNVASSATNVTLLSSNSNRLGATIYNDSTANLYVKFGTTASATSFTVLMAPGSYYEVPNNYTGRIDGVWASANGNARVTELT